MSQNNFIKNSLVILATFMLTSCVNTKALNNLQQLQSGTVAGVVSGCTYIYEIDSWFEKEAIRKCLSTWQDEKGDRFSIDGHSGISFIKPGTYEFVALDAQAPLYSTYKKHNGAISVFKKLSVKGGEVIYIGHLNVDARNTKQLLKSMTFSDKSELANTYLQKQYPTLVDKMQVSLVTFSTEAEMVKKLLSSDKG